MLYEVITIEEGRKNNESKGSRCIRQAGFDSLQGVITSYSIHYTKLYEEHS